MPDRLTEYRAKRDRDRTPEPVPAGAPGARTGGEPAVFVIQQHHARALHWDLRLERDGVLVSWAVPRGIPRDPERNHLAVHTEDHPMEYADFSGEIPAGEYGAGHMHIFDRGTYETEKWRDNEVIVRLHGDRVDGRFVLFRTGGKDWMIHRMDGPPEGFTPMPEVEPMRATEGKRLPTDDDAWAYELEWAGRRAMAEVSGGRLRLLRGEEDLVRYFPELRAMAERLAPTECLLDGVLIALDESGRVSPEALARRFEHAGDTAAGKRLAARVPAQYFAFDLLWLEGAPALEQSYVDRRELLAGLRLSGPHWQTPPHFAGGGRAALDTARVQGAPGLVAKRLDARYEPGKVSKAWRRIPA